MFSHKHSTREDHVVLRKSDLELRRLCVSQAEDTYLLRDIRGSVSSRSTHSLKCEHHDEFLENRLTLHSLTTKKKKNMAFEGLLQIICFVLTELVLHYA